MNGLSMEFFDSFTPLEDGYCFQFSLVSFRLQCVDDEMRRSAHLSRIEELFNLPDVQLILNSGLGSKRLWIDGFKSNSWKMILIGGINSD